MDTFLYRSWIMALKREIQTILYNHKIKLTVPNVTIDESIQRWGKWDPLTKTIHVSRRLITCCSWDSVVETLKHELAHMLVDDYDTSAHGEKFKEACRMLGTSSKAQASDADMGLSLESRDQASGSGNCLLDKIKKLLALSGSMNEHEAAQALRKANELIMKYNISLNSENKFDEYEYKRIGGLKTKRTTEEILICNILKDFFLVEYIVVPSFDALDNKRVFALEIMGLRENLEMAEYVFCFLTNHCDLLWQQYKLINSARGITARKSYLIGLLEGFRQTMDSSLQAASKNELMVLNEGMLHEFCSYRHPRTVRIKKGGMSITPGAYHQGKSDGKKVIINRPINRTGIINAITRCA